MTILTSPLVKLLGSASHKQIVHSTAVEFSDQSFPAHRPHSLVPGVWHRRPYCHDMQPPKRATTRTVANVHLIPVWLPDSPRTMS